MTTRSKWSRHDPRARDWQRAAGALAARQAIRCRKAVAARLGVSVDRVDAICTGADERILRIVELLLAVDAPEHIAGHVQATALRRPLRTMIDRELLALFWALMDEAAQAQARQEQRARLFARTGDLQTLGESSQTEAALDARLAAVCVELHERKIDARVAGKAA